MIYGFDIPTLFIMIFVALIVGMLVWKVFRLALKTAIFAGLIVVALFLIAKIFELI